MADKKISELDALTGANTADDDRLVIVDTSAGLTKSITMAEFKNAFDSGSGFVRVTGDTMTGDLALSGADVTFGDNDKAIFGADLEIYHDGNAQIINAVGQLNIDNNGDNKQINLRSDDGAGGITNYLRANGNTGAVQLYHYGSSKLATTSTGVDITGTLTSDSLTVDGNVANITLNNTDTTIGQQRLSEINFDQNDPDGAGVGTVASIYALNRGSSSGFGALVFQTGTASTLADRMRIEYTGDIDFYASDGTTPAFHWDAADERLGIGTSSPSRPLQVAMNNAGATVASLKNSGATAAMLGFQGSGSANDSNVRIGVSDNTDFTVTTNNSEAMRIDSSQRVLIGYTANISVADHNAALQVVGQGTADYHGATASIIGFSNNSNGAYLNFGSGRSNTAGTYTVVANNDTVGEINFSAADGTDMASRSARITSYIDGAPGSNDMPGRIAFYTSSDGASNPTERMRINSAGDVKIGSAGTPETKLQVQGGSLENGTILMGANYNGTGMSQNSEKTGALHHPVYVSTTSPKGYRLIAGYADSTRNMVQIGGGTSSAKAATQIVLYTAASATASSNTEAMRIDSSQRVLIGTNTSRVVGGSAQAVTQIYNTSNGALLSLFRDQASNNGGAIIRGGKARNGAIVQDNDTIFSLEAVAHDGTDMGSFAGTIAFLVDGTPGANDTPSRIAFYTTADGAASGTERMRITNGGVIGIRDASPFAAVPLNIGGMSSENALGGPTAGTNDLVGARISLYAGNTDHQLYMGDNGWEMCGNSISRFAYKSGTNANNGDAVATIKWGITGTGRWLFGTETDISGDGAGALGIVQSDGGARIAFRGTASASGGNVGMLAMSNTSYANNAGGIHYLACRRANSSAWSFGGWYSTSNGSSDREFNFRGDGNGYADGSWNGGGADYAEYFEWSDGNSSAEDRRGMTVALVGNKIRVATADDPTSSIIGVVSASPAVVGDTAWNHWSERYLRDEFGSYQRETYTLTEWDGEVMGTETNPDGSEYQKLRTERLSYHTDQIPSDVTPPSDAVVVSVDGNGDTLTRRVSNPDYDSTRTYVPREDRPEWDAVGMVGKLRTRVGQPIGDRWIKLRDISANVEEWLVR